MRPSHAYIVVTFGSSSQLLHRFQRWACVEGRSHLLRLGVPEPIWATVMLTCTSALAACTAVVTALLS